MAVTPALRTMNTLRIVRTDDAGSGDGDQNLLKCCVLIPLMRECYGNTVDNDALWLIRKR